VKLPGGFITFQHFPTVAKAAEWICNVDNMAGEKERGGGGHFV